jgi:putative ABC transport system permease protein
MLLYYFKIAFRNMIKNPGYAVINVTGLAIGMACSLLILMWVYYELSYDRFRENAYDIDRVVQEVHFTDHTTNWAITQGPLGPALKEDFPEVVDFTRFTGKDFLLSYDSKNFDETVILVDGSLFEVFSLPLSKGNPATALSEPSAMVLTEAMAEKYFGHENPMGKTITADHLYKFVVTGVLKDIPHNSVFHEMGFFIPFIFGRQLNFSVDRWNNSSFHTLIQLRPGTSVREFAKKIAFYLKTKPTIEKNSLLQLQPFTGIRLDSRYEFDVSHDVTFNTLIFFAVNAGFILLIAWVNFMNLATARSAKRAREIGLRKVVGARRLDIVSQFLGESILHAFIALLTAIVLVDLLLPVFNRIANQNLSLAILADYKIIISLLALILITGLVSGSYPALFLSAFDPIRILRGSLRLGPSGTRLRKILITFTFMFAIFMIITALGINKQLTFMLNKNLGYEKELLLQIEMRGDLPQKFKEFKKELLQHKYILNVTASSGTPGIWGYRFSNSLWHWEGQDPDEEILMRVVHVADDFIETFGMDMVQGRIFSKNPSAVSAGKEVMINETAAKIMDMASPVGQQLSIGEQKLKIIGVIRDYHLRSLHEKIDPLILLYQPEMSRVMFTRVSTEHVAETIRTIERIYNKWTPGYPFEYHFLDERVSSLYDLERRAGKITGYFSLLTVIIACVGLFGLASFMAEQRQKEIGIRKVLGASVRQMVVMLIKEFVKCIIIANVFAWPIAYIAMNDLLEDYAYHIEMGITNFLLAGLLALVIALVTVSYQAFKAALANPVDVIRYE